MQLRLRSRLYLRSLLVAPLLVVALAASSRAQEKAVLPMIGKDIEYFARDIWSVWTSPFDAHGRDLLAGLYVLGIGVAISPVDDEVDRWAARSQGEWFFDAVEEFRKDGSLYGGGALAPVAGGIYLIGVITKKQGMRDAITGCGATWLSNNILRRQVLYRFIGRERPDPTRGEDPRWPAAEPGDQYKIQWNGFEGAEWGMRSFPGGHIANIMGCASFFNHRFKWGVAEPVLYGIAGAVLLARIADRAHWLSDQWVGTVFGFAVGKEVAHQQLRRKARRDAMAGSGSIAPSGMRDGLFVTRYGDATRIGWQKTF